MRYDYSSIALAVGWHKYSTVINYVCNILRWFFNTTPDSKFHAANMGPIWGRQDPGGPHVGPMNFAIWDHTQLDHLYLTILVQKTSIYIVHQPLHGNNVASHNVVCHLIFS